MIQHSVLRDFPRDDEIPRILIVDDEPNIRAVIRRALASTDFEIVEARNGREALDAFGEGGADVILSDVLMPGMGGLELLSAVKAVDDTVGFIILTGNGGLDSAVEALRLQADDYLTKPFDLNDVVHSVKRSLRQRRLLRENRFYQENLESRVAEQDRQIENIFAEGLLCLANAIEARDGYTGGHVERVTRYALAIGSEYGLDADVLQRLWVGALLHDVGKIGVPDHILKKTGALTDEEYATMKEHPAIGARILERSSSLRPALPGVLHHQERWDGQGYPEGLKGREISIEGRILSVADTFDAIISDRPYRDHRSHEDAVAEIRRCSGSQFDPAVVEAFVRAREKGFPHPPSVPAMRRSAA